MIDLSIVGGCEDGSLPTAGEGDQSIEDWGTGPDCRRFGEAREVTGYRGDDLAGHLQKRTPMQARTQPPDDQLQSRNSKRELGIRGI
jgi:hypothetical protein